MRVLVAPDKFKGTLTAREAAALIADAAAALGHDVRVVPMADGGDGTLEALGGANRHTVVSGPLGVQVRAGWRLVDGQAVVESAQASGLVLAGESPDAVAATSAGTGELIAAALAAGADQVLVGVGGTASTDGGLGAVDALDAAGVLGLAPGRVTVLADVRTRFGDAAIAFGPQKGADAGQVALLTARLGALAEQFAVRFGARGLEMPGVEGSGAGGGLAGGLYAAGADIVPGADAIADRAGLAAEMGRTDLVITGEGRFDAGSFAGKGPGHVLALAGERGVPALVIAGSADRDIRPPGDVTVVSLVDAVGAATAVRDAAVSLRHVATDALTRT